MAAGPSPNSASPSSSGATASPFLHSSFSSTSASSSPPNSTATSQPGMTAEVFSATSPGIPHGYTWSALGEKKMSDRSSSSLRSLGADVEQPLAGSDMKATPTIYIRKLPRTTGTDALRSMLLFAKDLVDVEFVPVELVEDKGFSSAMARFKTLAGARDAKEKLHGKANAANDANMVVEIFQNGPPATLRARSNTVDGTVSRQSPASASPGPSANGANNVQTTWRNGKYQQIERVSPPTATAGLGNGDFTVPDSKGHFQSVFSPQSPIGPSFQDQARASGKSLINDNDDAGDDEELLKDTVAFSKPSHPGTLTRRTTNPQMPVSRFAGLSLSTNGAMSPPMSSFSSPRSVAPMQSPNPNLSAMSPSNIPSAMARIGQVTPTNYQLSNQHFRHNYPPVNPADQNPPCNTLYVGNLPIDTSEDELKAMFSKQRGYKRLCFRTKQNGPMCFVEFEDVSHATRALNELYGQPLHNSVKGGIRLSFSKNPLGVRTGQNHSAGGQAPPPQAAMPGMSNGIPAPTGFSTATGPPPGLAPPGLASPVGVNGNSVFGAPSFAMNSTALNNHLRGPIQGNTQISNGNGNFNGMSDGYSAYMMGR